MRQTIKRALQPFPQVYALAHYAKVKARGRSRTPHNQIRRDPNALQEDVAYAMNYTRGLMDIMERHGVPISGARVLELGPGTNLGPQLILASLGAHVTVADPFPFTWDPDYHPRLYQALAQAWQGQADKLKEAVAQGSHDGLLTILAEPAENLVSVESEAIDFVFSNAVLEHIVDITKVSVETARVTRTGGFAFHTIDLRDHRNFDKPLEHIVHGERFFQSLVQMIGYEMGNRLRSIEFWAHFEKSGWQVLARNVNMTAEPTYLAEFIPRLRRANSAYRHWPAEDLARVGVDFILRKNAQCSSPAECEAVSDRLTLIDAVKQLR